MSLSDWDIYETITLPNGDELYYARILVGGRDEEGIYELVLDGPAQGEKEYG